SRASPVSRAQAREHSAHQRLQIVKAVARSDQDDHCNAKPGQILLVLELAVDCQEYVEVAFGELQELAVSLLAQPISGAVFVSWPGSSRLRRRGRHSSSRTRTGEKGFFGLLQRGDCLRLRDGREVFQEFRKRLAGFEVIDQSLKRHTRSHEYGSAA